MSAPRTVAPAAADTRALFVQYRASGDRGLRNDLVERHLQLADYYVRRYGGRGVASDDLQQVALLAVLRAVERFDPDLGIEFSTFASRTIEGEVKRYFRDRTWSVRPPRRMQELHLELRRAEEELLQRLGRSPTVQELATEVDDSVDHVLEAMEAGVAHNAGSLDQPDRDGERTTAADRDLAHHETGFALVDSQIVLRDLLGELPDRERQIIELRFFQGLTQPEIARIVGVSQSYLSRILRRTLLELRHRLEPVDDGAPPGEPSPPDAPVDDGDDTSAAAQV